MKRSIAAAVACSVWLTGIASAAALTQVLEVPVAPSTVLARIPEYGSMRRLAAPEGAVHSVLQVPVVTIVARSARIAAVAPAVAAPRDIAEMSCAGWRDLDIGSGRVQICQ